MLVNHHTSALSIIAVLTHGIHRWPFFSKRTRSIGSAYILLLLDEIVKESEWLSEAYYLVLGCVIVLVSFTLQVCFFQMLWKTYVSNLLLPMLTVYFLTYAFGNFIFYEHLTIIVPHLRWVQAILILIFAITSIYLLRHPVFRKLNDLSLNRLIGMCVGLILYYVGVLLGWV
ncbi:MAG: hypothetical protein R8G66_15900 [Cytophagales bacterium]|nr:hypothetical protein [Cytophagales bacterium]